MVSEENATHYVDYVVKSTRSATSSVIISFVVVFVGWVISLYSSIYILLLVAGALSLFWILKKPERSVYACMLLIFVPICVTKYLGNTVPISYFIIPIVTALYLLQKFPRGIPYSLRWRLNPLLIPIAVYFSVVFINYLRNPILPGDLSKLGYAPQGFRAWFGYLLSFCVYFVFAEVVSTNIKITQKTIKFLWRLCLILGVLGVILIYSRSAQNVLYNLQSQGIISHSFFETSGSDFLSTRYRLPTGGYRIGTLEGIASIGLILLLAGTYKVKNILKWILCGFFGYGLILSGGRGGFAGIVLALLIWMMVQKKPRYLIVSFMVLLSLYLGIFVFYEALPGSLQRILKIRGSFEHLDVGRASVFLLYWELFLHHPLFGMGMGSSSFRYSSNWLSFFTSEQLRIGGHGTYISILYLMGLAGFIPFVWGLVGSLKFSYSLSKKEDHKFNLSLAMFCFLWLVFYLIPMGFGGRGASMLYFAIIGIVSGLCIRRRYEKKQSSQF